MSVACCSQLAAVSQHSLSAPHTHVCSNISSGQSLKQCFAVVTPLLTSLLALPDCQLNAALSKSIEGSSEQLHALFLWLRLPEGPYCLYTLLRCNHSLLAKLILRIGKLVFNLTCMLPVDTALVVPAVGKAA